MTAQTTTQDDKPARLDGGGAQGARCRLDASVGLSVAETSWSFPPATLPHRQGTRLREALDRTRGKPGPTRQGLIDAVVSGERRATKSIRTPGTPRRRRPRAPGQPCATRAACGAWWSCATTSTPAIRAALLAQLPTRTPPWNTVHGGFKPFRAADARAFLHDLGESPGDLDAGVKLTNPDFAAMARGAGLFARRVEDPAELKAAMAEFLGHDGPALLDVVSARLELAMPPKVGVAQAAGFGLWVARAVISGRGTEIVDVARTNLIH